MQGLEETIVKPSIMLDKLLIVTFGMDTYGEEITAHSYKGTRS